jgi:hypothetical protein
MFNSRKIKELEKRIWELENPPLKTGVKVFLSGHVCTIVKSQTQIDNFFGITIYHREYIVLHGDKSWTHQVKFMGEPTIYNPKIHKVKK